VCAQAYVALARAESGFPGWPGLPPRERFPKVKEAATKAIELESNNAAAHALLGGAAFNTGEWCAVSFIREVRQHCEKIADGPHHYAARPDLGDTIRICPHGNYLIVFEPFDDGALILRVLHGARNVPGVLGS
jgi:plasmid stabilization system protein ParE